jgi:hypothetical protein
MPFVVGKLPRDAPCQYTLLVPAPPLLADAVAGHDHATREGDSTARAYPHRGRFGERRASKTNARVVVEGGECLAVRAERAVRHCGKFPNAHVAPLRAGRQCKPLWLLQ